jgi:hypothetical protein
MKKTIKTSVLLKELQDSYQLAALFAKEAQQENNKENVIRYSSKMVEISLLARRLLDVSLHNTCPIA